MGVSFFHSVQSFVQFLLNWTLKGGKLVEQGTADARAAICSACHNNKPTSEIRNRSCCGGNKVANAVISAARSKIIKDAKSTNDAKLLACAICGCDNKISVWIPNNVLLKPEDANAYPSFCWKKKITEGQDV